MLKHVKRADQWWKIGGARDIEWTLEWNPKFKVGNTGFSRYRDRVSICFFNLYLKEMAFFERSIEVATRCIALYTVYV